MIVLSSWELKFNNHIKNKDAISSSLNQILLFEKIITKYKLEKKKKNKAFGIQIIRNPRTLIMRHIYTPDWNLAIYVNYSMWCMKRVLKHTNFNSK